MSFALAALTAGWCAAAIGMLFLSLPAASVAKLLSPRWARAKVLAWAMVAVVGLALFVVTLLAAPAWAHEPLRYTPHLERPLPHLCFRGAAEGWLGVGLVRAFSVLTTVLLIAAVLRFAVVSLTDSTTAAGHGSPAPTELTQGVHEGQVLLNDGNGPLASTRGKLRPATFLSAELARTADGPTLRAILAHEADHVRWRDPLLHAAVASLAVAWPVPGLLLLREIRQAAEVAADAHARTRAGPEACREAIELMGPLGAQEDVAERLRALEESDTASPAGALAAGASWLLVGAALLALYWQPIVLSLICLFETVAAAWQG
ncbi:MAG: hypothetical protein J7M26_10435 [Armatimonadetes bacterium]|nr:hypothetical protein [Armatimonadota bacterium]